MHHPENDDKYKGLTVNAGIEQPAMVNPYMKPKKRKRLFTPAEYVEGIVKGDITMLSRAVTLVESLLPEHHTDRKSVV